MGQGLLSAAAISVKKVAVCFLYDIYYTDTGNNDNTYIEAPAIIDSARDGQCG